MYFPPAFLYLLLVLSMWTREHTSMKLLHGVLVRFVNDTSESTPIYILTHRKNSTSKGILRQVPSCFTAKRFGFDCKDFYVLSNSSDSYAIGESLPSMEPRSHDPDEFMRLELTHINTVQPNLLLKIDYLGEYVWHPSMIRFLDRVLLSARGAEPVTHEIPHFHWLDISENQTLLSNPISIDNMGFNFVGKEQVRMVHMSNYSIHMSFTVCLTFKIDYLIFIYYLDIF